MTTYDDYLQTLREVQRIERKIERARIRLEDARRELAGLEHRAVVMLQELQTSGEVAS
jgi:hypothetical protein